MDKKYQAREFLQRFGDQNILPDILRQFDSVDFTNASKDILTTDKIENLCVKNLVHSFAGLEVFTNIKEFECGDKNAKRTVIDKPYTELVIPESWNCIESIVIMNCFADKLVFPKTMNNLRKLLIFEDYAIPNDMSWEDRHRIRHCLDVQLPENIPNLKEISIDIDEGKLETFPAKLPMLEKMHLAVRFANELYIEEAPDFDPKSGCLIMKPRQEQDQDSAIVLTEIKNLRTLSTYMTIETIIVACLPEVQSIKHRSFLKNNMILFDLPVLELLAIGGSVSNTLRLPGAHDDFMLQDQGGSFIDAFMLLKMPEINHSIKIICFGLSDCNKLLLPEMTALESLDFNRGSVQELILPRNLPAVLDLWENEIAKLDIADNQPKLKSLYIGSTQITSLRLSGHRELETLNAGSTPLRRLELTNLPKLAWLDLSCTEINSWWDIKPSNPEALEQLSISIGCADELADILASAPKLNYLYVYIEKDMDLRLLFGKMQANIHKQLPESYYQYASEIGIETNEEFQEYFADERKFEVAPICVNAASMPIKLIGDGKAIVPANDLPGIARILEAGYRIVPIPGNREMYQYSWDGACFTLNSLCAWWKNAPGAVISEHPGLGETGGDVLSCSIAFLIEHPETCETIRYSCTFCGLKAIKDDVAATGNERIPYLRYIDVDNPEIRDGRLCIWINFQVSSVTRGAFEIGGHRFEAKDGDWTEEEERVTLDYFHYGSRKISYVEWDIPDGFRPKLREWKILGLYDHYNVQIFAEGVLAQNE